MKIEFELDDRIAEHYPPEKPVRAIQFADGTIVIEPPGPYNTTVASAAFSTFIQRIATGAAKVTS